MTRYRLFTDNDVAYLQVHDAKSDLWRFVARLTPAYINGNYLRIDQLPTQLHDVDKTHLMQLPNTLAIEALAKFADENPDFDAYMTRINDMRAQYLDFTIN